jgi:hypothetical protein
LKIKDHSEFRVTDYFLSRTVASHSVIHVPKFESLSRNTFIVSDFFIHNYRETLFCLTVII